MCYACYQRLLWTLSHEFHTSWNQIWILHCKWTVWFITDLSVPHNHEYRDTPVLKYCWGTSLKCWLSTCNTVEGNQTQHTDRLSHFIPYSCKINFYIGMWLVPIISNYFLFWIYFNIWLCNITEQYVSAVRQLIQLILIFHNSNNLPKCITRTLFTPQETVNTLSMWLMLQDIAQCVSGNYCQD